MINIINKIKWNCLYSTMPALLASALVTSACVADDDDEGQLADSPSAGDVFKDPSPSQSLDPRVDASKITETDLPPLPNRRIAPLPAVLRISDEASQVPISPELWAQARNAINKGLDFLRTQQDERGGWMTKDMAAPTDQPDRPSSVGLAVTSMAVKAFGQAGDDAGSDPQIRKALRMIVSSRNPDGSFDNSSLSNYVTSAVLMGLASVKDEDVEFAQLSDEAAKWLQTNQWDQGEGLSPRQDWFGGAGYGRSGRPDMSNTQMMLDALHDAGLSPDEPAFQRALAFASRTQNLKSTNPAPWAGDDGGFIYTPANGGESMASEAAGEGRSGELIPVEAGGQPGGRSLRSYGSMTYAGFKSMLYAGLSPDDVRVRAAFDWVRRNWTFEENPGMGQQGLFYYYHTMARALLAAQQHEITDIEGTKHNWREELVQTLLKRQQEDGSWVNTHEERWMENSQVLVTVYSVLALEECLKPVTTK